MRKIVICIILSLISIPSFCQVKEGVLLEPISSGFSLNKISDKSNTVVIFKKKFKVNNKVSHLNLDTLNLGNIGRSKLVIMASCRLNKKNDSEIIALVNYKAIEHYYLILVAWRANKRTGKFEKIPVKGIDCIDGNYTDED